MRLVRSVFGISLVLAGLLAVARGVSPATPPSPPSALCRADPLQGVHHPWRLKLISPCAQFVGVLTEDPKPNPSDGDVTVDVSPDPGYETMLNDKNRAEGGIHVEVVPRDQPGCTPGQPVTGTEDNLGTCSGAAIQLPQKGARVRMIGAHVLDSWVGWNEIHPAWRVDVLSGTPSPPPPPRPAGEAPVKLAAHLTGRAEVPVKGPLSATGDVKVTIEHEKLCWTFTTLRRLGRPTRARIHRGVVRRAGPAVLALGSRYRARGCVSAAERVLEPIEEAPTGFYVNVSTSTYPAGAVRGQLRSAQ
jgi:CHRD domain